MIFPRDLAIKGLGAVAAGAGVAYSAWHFQDPILKFLGIEPSLLRSVGLKCDGENICTPIDVNTRINVKHGDTSESNKTLTINNGAKLRLQMLTSEDGNYPGNIRLVVEGGDITLGSSDSNNSISKLSRYESYAIEKIAELHGDKYFLTRRTEASGGIGKSLGIGTCTLPSSAASPSECTDLDSEKLKLINFKDKGESGATISSGSAKLTISKLTNRESEFPHNYKFVLESPSGAGDITIPGTTPITIKTGEKMEFKIKKDENSEALSLERAWDIASLIAKVGLKDCGESNSECQIADGGLKIKQGDSTAENKTKQDSNSSGKIKLYTGSDAEGYNEGFKFAIEEGDITLSNTGTPNKLEEFETYEITAQGDKYYLTRKENVLEAKWRLLGLPKGDNCKFPENESSPITCPLDKGKIGSIRFEGKTEGQSPTVTEGEGDDQFNLKVSKVSTGPFSGSGYRLVLESNRNITVPKSGGDISIKKDTNTEFRIKTTTPTGGGAKTLSLEKAWSVEELAQKSGFSGCWSSSGTKKCTFKTGVSFGVLDGSTESDKIESAKISDSDKTMTYEEDAEGHNQGIKFFVDDDITLENASSKKIHKKGSATYEIIEKTESSGTKWYLSKKGVSS